MGRLILRWVGLALFVAVIATACIFLGRWQLHRLDDRRATNHRIEAATTGPVLPFGEVFASSISDDNQWQRVQVTGTYLPDSTVVVRDRQQNHNLGVAIVTALRADDGRIVFVDRGFIAGVDRAMTRADAPRPPTGTVTVVGISRRNERGPDNATVPDDEGRARLIRSDTFAHALGFTAVDGYIDATQSSPADDPNLTPIALPEISDGPHFWYAMQWFLFGSLAIVGLVWFVRNDIRERRKADQPDGDVVEESVAQ